MFWGGGQEFAHEHIKFETTIQREMLSIEFEVLDLRMCIPEPRIQCNLKKYHEPGIQYKLEKQVRPDEITKAQRGKKQSKY